MSRYGSIIGGDANAVGFIVQGATPEALLAASGVAGLKAFGPLQNPVITSITLTGAGDGHMFFLEVQGTSGVHADGGIDATTVMVDAFLGADAEALTAALAEAGAAEAEPLIPFSPPPSTGPLIDVQIAGAAKGQRVLGLVLYGQLNSSSSASLRTGYDNTDPAATQAAYTNGTTTPVLRGAAGAPVSVTMTGFVAGDVMEIAFTVQAEDADQSGPTDFAANVWPTVNFGSGPLRVDGFFGTTIAKGTGIGPVLSGIVAVRVTSGMLTGTPVVGLMLEAFGTDNTRVQNAQLVVREIPASTVIQFPTNTLVP